MNTTAQPTGSIRVATEGTGKAEPSGTGPAARPTPSESLLLVLGAALIIEALVRFGFVVNNLLIVPASVLREQPYLLAVSIVLPSILAFAALASGVLMMLRTPIARSVGIAVCSICLVFQLYGFANGLYLAATTPGLVLPWTFWMFGPVYSALFIACIVCLARWRPAYPPLIQP